MTKLRSLGIRVFVVNEHLESHPLARARYIRLFGALTGRMEEARSNQELIKQQILEAVQEMYDSDFIFNVSFGEYMFQ